MDQGQSQHDAQIKIITLGTQSVGKSSLLRQYFEASYQDKYKATIGVDLKLKTKTMENGKTVKVQIFDTAGQEKFRSIVGSYYKGAHGVALVYDITNYKTFEDAQVWYRDMKMYCPENISIILIGNKLDLQEQRCVTQQEAENLAKEFGMIFFETSAKDNLYVNDAFDKIIDIIYKKELESREKSSPSRITNSTQKGTTINLSRSSNIQIDSTSNVARLQVQKRQKTGCGC